VYVPSFVLEGEGVVCGRGYVREGSVYVNSRSSSVRKRFRFRGGGA